MYKHVNKCDMLKYNGYYRQGNDKEMDWFCCACKSKLFLPTCVVQQKHCCWVALWHLDKNLQKFAFHGITASGIGQSMHYTMVSLPIVDDKKQGFQV